MQEANTNEKLYFSILQVRLIKALRSLKTMAKIHSKELRGKVPVEQMDGLWACITIANSKDDAFSHAGGYTDDQLIKSA